MSNINNCILSEDPIETVGSSDNTTEDYGISTSALIEEDEESETPEIPGGLDEDNSQLVVDFEPITDVSDSDNVGVIFYAESSTEGNVTLWVTENSIFKYRFPEDLDWTIVQFPETSESSTIYTDKTTTFKYDTGSYIYVSVTVRVPAGSCVKIQNTGGLYLGTVSTCRNIYKVSGTPTSLIDPTMQEGSTFTGTLQYLFYNSRELVDASDLRLDYFIPSDGCFESMFQHCTNLVYPPTRIPVVSEKLCYNMFYNCTSLTQAPELPATTLADYCYSHMFYNCTSLTQAPELPATTLADYCYYEMFWGCTSLTQAPELPATTLTAYCYYEMFWGCRSLTQAPELPATTLDGNCYYSMFQGCTSLTQAPELPATTLAYSCYYRMFQGCTSLTQAPELPATTLADYCYSYMFSGCTSLTQAPELPATTLDGNCYYSMFYGCTSLTTAPELPATRLDVYCYSHMFYSCTSLTQAPELPATRLAHGCYSGMFLCCTSLTQAPELPATTLGSKCYYSMFQGCTSLTTAPELPATTLDGNCYYSMFQGCTSLTQAPELPATTLTAYCYYEMFWGCTSLTQAPELPATTLANNCYQYMFQGCTSLTQAPELPATTLASSCYYRMFLGCISLEATSDLPATNVPDYSYFEMYSGCSSMRILPEIKAKSLEENSVTNMFKDTKVILYKDKPDKSVYYTFTPEVTFSIDFAKSGDPEITEYLCGVTYYYYNPNAKDIHDLTGYKDIIDRTLIKLNLDDDYNNWYLTSLENDTVLILLDYIEDPLHLLFPCFKIKLIKTPQEGVYRLVASDPIFDDYVGEELPEYQDGEAKFYTLGFPLALERLIYQIYNYAKRVYQNQLGIKIGPKQD